MWQNGKVEGIFINQFSLDEDEGSLRIAITLNTNDSTNRVNQVVILDSNLKEIGKLEDIAKR